MGKTTKWEHRTDSFHENHRTERKARPAGRLKLEIERQLAEEEDFVLSGLYDVMEDYR